MRPKVGKKFFHKNLTNAPRKNSVKQGEKMKWKKIGGRSEEPKKIKYIYEGERVSERTAFISFL